MHMFDLFILIYIARWMKNIEYKAGIMYVFTIRSNSDIRGSLMWIPHIIRDS